MSELLPCPFCDGKAELDTHRGYLNFMTSKMENEIAVYCTRCSAEIAVCYKDVPDITPEQVIDMWNTRQWLKSKSFQQVKYLER